MNIGPKLARQVGHANSSHYDYLVNSVQSSTSMFMNPIDPSEIINALKAISHQVMNIEYISSKAVKAVAQCISNTLSDSIYHFPLCW